MYKFQRNERIAVLMKILSDSPGRIYTLGEFSKIFGAAKSTISEDIDIVQGLMKKFDMGTIQAIPGASGGVRYIPGCSRARIRNILESLSEELSKKENKIM